MLRLRERRYNMMKKISAVLFVILIIIGTILCWTYLFNDEWKWAKYTMTALSSVVILLLTRLWYKKYIKKQSVNEKHDQQILLNQDTCIIEQLFKVATKKIRGTGRNKLDSLYSLPWYLVLGNGEDDKSDLLRQNGLEPIFDKHLEGGDPEQYLKFWNNDQIVVIEVGHRLFSDEGIDEQLWQVLANQLLRYRPRQGLNGAISIIGCNRLLESDRQDCQKLSNVYQEAILSMGRMLALTLPVYSVFSKADSIADFVEFFEGFSGRDVENPLGVTFPYTKSRRFDKYQFEDQSKVLIKAVAQQQFELLRNINSEKTSSIIALPYQLRIFLERVNELLTDIGHENRVREAVWLRGVYLLSSGKKGREHDLLTQVIAERTEFNSHSYREQKPSRRSYFSTRLFSHVILPEKGITGVNELRHSGYLVVRSVMVLLVLGAGAFTGSLLKNNWNQDEQFRADAMTQVRLYSNDVKRLNNNYSISDTIALLNELRDVSKKGIEPKSWYQKISIKQTETADRIYKAYEDQLNLILLPKIEKLISSELYAFVSLSNPNKIFEVLRYYQMLFDVQRLNISEMKGYIINNMKVQGDLSSDDINILSLLITDLFNGNYQHRLEKNNSLIAVATNNLEGLSPERLIYARIKELPKYRNKVDIRRQLGAKFDTIFEFSNDFHGYLIPEIYTKQGYSTIDLTAKSELLRRQLGAFKEIQGNMSGASLMELTELSKQIQRLYFADYIYYWKDLVNNIQVKNFNSQAEFANALKNAREPATSPVLDVLGALVVNTTLAVEEQPNTKGNKKVANQLGLKKIAKGLSQADKINRAVGGELLHLQPSYVVNEAFVGYGNYVNGNKKAGTVIPLDSLIQEFDSLNTYFDAALSSSEPSKMMHEYALAHAAGSQDAIVQFQRQGAKAPNQVAVWTKDVSQKAWSEVINGSVGYLNQQWNEQIYQFYGSAIEGRFPFTLNGRGEVSLNDFAQFFKPQGRVDKFIDEQLKPFVYWNNGTLKRKTIDGLTLPISNKALAQLRQSHKLTQTFFGTAGQELALRFAVRPSSMSTTVTEFQIRESESIFSYRHGPRIWTDLNWPTTGVDGYLSTNFYQGKNRIVTRSYTGQWALFRALFDGHSSATSDRLIHKLNYKVENNSIALDYTLRDSNHSFSKSLFTSFALPRQL